ncbi:hypothetical protein [Shimazuella kribbensis]|uniref:hypothetical protein n=1 Tax=Shimazuella kribbensis TaxID=139808 RepID=UPI000401E5B1|nr:hypothetical protein [Shimazuella kribbensis]
MKRRRCKISRIRQIERVVQEELNERLLKWLERVSPPESGWQIPIETMVWMDELDDNWSGCGLE